MDFRIRKAHLFINANYQYHIKHYIFWIGSECYFRTHRRSFFNELQEEEYNIKIRLTQKEIYEDHGPQRHFFLSKSYFKTNHDLNQVCRSEVERRSQIGLWLKENSLSGERKRVIKGDSEFQSGRLENSLSRIQVLKKKKN